MLLRVQLALSLDGFVADASGGVAWLDPFMTPEMNFDAFLDGIGAIVMGRRTFDQVRGFGPWPYEGKACTILSRRPLPGDTPAGVRAATLTTRADALALRDDLARLTAPTGKDVWLMGGPESIRPFRDAGLVDRWELAVVPVLLGAGVPLFAAGPQERLALLGTRVYTNGIVELHYAPDAG